MYKIRHDEYKLNPCDVLLTEELTTYDIRYSIQRFIEENFTGCIRFADGDDLGASRNVLVDKYALAYVIKSIIKELTQKRVCEISFATSEAGFILRFHSRDSEPPSGTALSHITGAATHYGVDLAVDGFDITITLPVSPLHTVKVYSKHLYRFLVVLEHVFDEDTERE